MGRSEPNIDITPHNRSAQSLGLNLLPEVVIPTMIKFSASREYIAWVPGPIVAPKLEIQAHLPAQCFHWHDSTNKDKILRSDKG